MSDRSMPGEDDVVRAVSMISGGLRLLYDTLGPNVPLQEVVVESGETLWHLAETHLNNGQRWRELYLLNISELTMQSMQHPGGLTPQLVYPGTRLLMFAV